MMLTVLLHGLAPRVCVQEGQRHLHSAAYCAFASLVSSSQTQMKWFSKAMGG